MNDLATASAETPVGDLATELVTCRLESPTAATAVLSAASRLVQDMPAELAAEASVYAGLQRLACDIETTTFAADHIRQPARHEPMTIPATQPDPQVAGTQADAIRADEDFERLAR